MRELRPGYRRRSPGSPAGSDSLHRLQVEARLLTRVPSIGSWRHLIGRFFRVITAKPLSEPEREWVRRYLAAERSAFFAQGRADQRHAFEAGQRVGERSEMVRAALLHDIGKRHARLSPIARSTVTAMAKLGLPIGRRAHIYLAHGPLAAEELTQLGAEALVVDFAARHHGEKPDSISSEDWETLVTADR